MKAEESRFELLAVKIGAILGLLLVPWLGLRIGPENALLALCIAGATFALGFGLWVRRWAGNEPVPFLAPEEPDAAVDAA